MSSNTLHFLSYKGNKICTGAVGPVVSLLSSLAWEISLSPLTLCMCTRSFARANHVKIVHSRDAQCNTAYKCDDQVCLHRLGPAIKKSICNVVFNIPFWGSFAQDAWPRRCCIGIRSCKLGGLHSSWLRNVEDWHAVDASCCTTDVHNACRRWSVCPSQVGYPWCWTQKMKIK